MRTFASGVVTAAIVFSACTLLLDTVTQPAYVINTDNSGDFGTVVIGQQRDLTITISPQSMGNQNDMVTSITENCSEFDVTFSALPGIVSQTCSGGSGSHTPLCTSMSYSFTATFTPMGTSAHPASCDVEVVISGMTELIHLHGTAALPDKQIDVSPYPTAPIGDVRLGMPGSTAITVTSTGAMALNISSVVFNDLSGVFAISGAPLVPHVLGTNPDVYTVTCTPTAATFYSATLSISSDAINAPLAPTAVVTITCSGTTSTLDYSPKPVVFSGLRVGDAFQTQPVMISNSGASATITSYSLSGNPPELTISATTPRSCTRWGRSGS
jgi:hypothetical protein